MQRYHLGFIFHCSLLVRRARLIADGAFFDESLRYIGDAEWMARLYLKGYRFGRVERHIAAYRCHAKQSSTMANADDEASARRREEHARVDRELRPNPVLRRLIRTYDTLQQRRVKLLNAWHDGGGAQVWDLTSAWLRRR